MRSVSLQLRESGDELVGGMLLDLVAVSVEASTSA